MSLPRHMLLVLVLMVAVSMAYERPARAQTVPPPGDEQPYKLSDGPHKVAVIDEIVLHDLKRDRGIPVKIRYPEGQGTCPVIIFSHGAGGSKDGNVAATTHWASHGCVCILPTHTDSIALGRQRGEDVTLSGVVRSALTDPRGWVNRPRDVSFIIDSLDELEKRCPALAGRMDRKHIGVGGHSYGAFTSQVIGGATLDLPRRPPGLSLRDDRVCAVLLFSPQGRDQMGLTRRSWDRMAIPMMSLTGTNDRGAKGQDPDWRMEPYNFSPPPDKYLVFIEGANHFTFGGRLDRWGQDRLFDYVKVAGIAFWDAYLKDARAAREYLTSDALETWSKGAAKLHRK